MNLLASAKWLILFAIVVFASCKEKVNIGIPKPQDNIGVSFHDTLTIETSIVWNDSLNTSNSPNQSLMIGEYYDPYFGKLRGESFTTLFLDPASNNVQDPIFDSVVLSFQPLFTQNEDTSNLGTQNLEVRRLNELWDKTKTYYTSSGTLASGDNLVADGVFNFQVSRVQKYKVRLNESLGKELLGMAGKTNDEFIKQFSGLAITSTGQDNNSKMMSWRISNAEVDTVNNIRVYYHLDSAKNQVLSQRFLLGNDSAKYYRLVPDWSASKLKPLATAPNKTIATRETENLCFVQSNIGVYTKLKFPTIKNLGKGRNVVINRAQLIITCPDESEYPYASKPLLSFYKVGTDNKLIEDNRLLLAVQNNTGLYYATYNSTAHSYSIDVTNYIQTLIYNNSTDNALIIAPVIQSNLQTIDRAVFYDSSVQPSVSNENRLRLNLYYTVVD